MSSGAFEGIVMKIVKTNKNEYQQLIELWEASVRATHHFLPEENIESLKPLILEHYFDAVELRVVKDNSEKILGFIGVADANIEMLFIAPEYFKRGLGKLLLNFAVKHLSVTKVDVNEQNPEATAFYQRMGFKVIARSPLDGQGNAFPLLHLELTPSI